MGDIPVATLGVGCKPIPLLGMGTATYPRAPPDVVRSAILHAIGLGCRHFDTAAIYQSEQPLGEAIADALHQGLVSSREELFITPKLWCSDAHRDLVVPALQKSLSAFSDKEDPKRSHLHWPATLGACQKDRASRGLRSCAAMGEIPAATLGVGCKPIPLLGLGTAIYPWAPPDVVRSAIFHAIELGFRHFDTAAIYQSEQPLGEAVAEALRQGLVSSREELFITTKLWCSDAHRDLVVPALQNSLRNLGMDYVDLYLVHLPVSVKPGKHELAFNKDDLMTFDMAVVWEGMEQCRNLGLAKAIGVSNFSCKKLEALLGTAKIPPAVNQVEMNPLWQQEKLREFCTARGILVTAYSPLGGAGTSFGSNQVMGNSILKEIAEAKGKTIAQVSLRWVYEQGVSVLVKSFNEKRMEENLDVLNWELNEEERNRISQLPQSKTYAMHEFCSPTSQYKSPVELWDWEI